MHYMRMKYIVHGMSDYAMIGDTLYMACPIKLGNTLYMTCPIKLGDTLYMNEVTNAHKFVKSNS